MDITLPELGENVEEAEVLNILVRKGDAVTKDQPVLELETDKATFELPCPQAGTVSDIHVKKGDTVRVGQKILTLDARAPARAEPERTKGKDDAPRAAEARRTQPEAEREPEAGKAAEARKESEARKEPEGKREPEPREEPEAKEPEAKRPPEGKESPKAARRQAAGQQAAELEDAKQEEAEEAGADEASRAPEPARAEPAQEAAAGEAEVAAGPAARRLAREAGVDLVQIRGTGSGGRITPGDVQAFVLGRAPAAREKAPGTTPAAVEDVERWGPVERRALTGIEKAAARHLAASWNEIPHVTHHDVADVTDLEEARARYEARRKESEPKLTWTALVVKAVVAGLRAFPRVNGSLDAARDELVLKRYIHVGVAVDTEHGLLVPVIRDADRKTTRALGAEIAALAARARERKLGREEMQGASFTVTNLGGIGGVAFTPIVSRPEVAILGVSRSREDLALRDGQVVRRVVLPLSLSYDHRVINGAEAARFVRYVAELLEDPLHLLLES